METKRLPPTVVFQRPDVSSTTPKTTAKTRAEQAPPPGEAAKAKTLLLEQPTVFQADGTTSKTEAAKVPTTSGGPVKGGVLGFLLQSKAAPLLVAADEILPQAKNASMTALLTLRAQCPPEFSPLVELTRADGSTLRGQLKGLDGDGKVVIDTGFGKKVALDTGEELRAVRHQMDTDGDLHTALVTVFDHKTQVQVSDPWQLAGFAGKTLNVETWDVEFKDLATAAAKGDVSERALQLAGVSKAGLELQGGGTLAKEFWNISRISLEQPAYSYKKEGTRLSDVGVALAAGTAVDVTVAGGRTFADRRHSNGSSPQGLGVTVGASSRTLQGTFLGVAKDAEGADYIVVQAKNGVRHALRDVLDVKAEACTLPLWQDKGRTAIYGS